jgi:hypothetical protein
VVAAALVVADHLGARFPDQVGGHRVAEDQGLLVDHQVGGAGRGRSQRGLAGLSIVHAVDPFVAGIARRC